MIEPGLYARLVAQVATVSSRVYPIRLPQSVTYPALVYRLVSAPRIQTHNGPMGKTFARYDIAAYGTTYATAKAAAEQVRIALDGFSGTMNDVTVANIRHDGERDLHDPEAENGSGVYFVVGEFVVEYSE